MSDFEESASKLQNLNPKMKEMIAVEVMRIGQDSAFVRVTQVQPG
jgi:hypothetical protein